MSGLWHMLWEQQFYKGYIVGCCCALVLLVPVLILQEWDRRHTLRQSKKLEREIALMNDKRSQIEQGDNQRIADEPRVTASSGGNVPVVQSIPLTLESTGGKEVSFSFDADGDLSCKIQDPFVEDSDFDFLLNTESVGKLREWLKVEQDRNLRRAFDMLSVLGVPIERARTVANGIDVLATRYNRQIHDLTVALKLKEDECRAQIAFISIYEAMTTVTDWNKDAQYAKVFEVNYNRLRDKMFPGERKTP